MKHIKTFEELVIVTSNPKKIKEYNDFGLNIKAETGLDLPEVDGNIDDVIIYKALDAGINKIVEDTVLEVDGVEIVDIRWKIKEMNKDADARWIVSLGVNDGERIKVYRGIINGKIIKKDNIKGFGFDEYFVPDGTKLTLGDLNKLGRKSDFSARRLAVENLVKDNICFEKKITQIKTWSGKYQH
jgi:inosine/xanthosine triphosphate pyrophosphatase family protein